MALPYVHTKDLKWFYFWSLEFQSNDHLIHVYTSGASGAPINKITSDSNYGRRGNSYSKKIVCVNQAVKLTNIGTMVLCTLRKPLNAKQNMKENIRIYTVKKSSTIKVDTAVAFIV